MNRLLKMLLMAGCLMAIAANAEPPAWGTAFHPFAATSPWNSRPVDPKFGNFEIPLSQYFPTVAEGNYSTGVFIAGPDDTPMTVHGALGKKGLWNPDAETFQPEIVIPRWPANVTPAAGNDGHADIVDPEAKIIHSFFQLRKIDGKWRATQYAWTRLDGRGWGEPAHYFQGSRAAGVPTMGGLIRKHEIDDGLPHFRHALAMSLAANALSAKPTFIFPATSADGNAASTNSGRIPQGALMMLPPGFDTRTIANADLRKVAETLKLYGAYVVDRNVGTPFVIYAENGSGYGLHKGGWNAVVAHDLHRIRAGLRQVVDTTGWIDGNGRPMQMASNLNRLSMRGPWMLQQGSKAGRFDTWSQAVVFPPTPDRVVMVNKSGRNISKMPWASMASGGRYRLLANTRGGGTLRLQLYGNGGMLVADSRELADGQSAEIVWPAGTPGIVITATSGGGDRESAVGGELLAIP